MLELYVPEDEIYLEETNEFVKFNGGKLFLEHSLISLRKWEAKHHKPYLTTEKNPEEILSYIECMTINREVDPMIYLFLTAEMLEQVANYIGDPMTATWFNTSQVGAAKTSNEVITAEIIYYWMIALNIPTEYEKWHLNQLLTLIKVVSIKNGGEKKLSPQEAALQRKRLNEERRKKYHTKG